LARAGRRGAAVRAAPLPRAPRAAAEDRVWAYSESSDVHFHFLYVAQRANISFPSDGISSTRSFGRKAAWLACSGLMRMIHESEPGAIHVLQAVPRFVLVPTRRVDIAFCAARRTKTSLEFGGIPKDLTRGVRHSPQHF